MLPRLAVAGDLWQNAALQKFFSELKRRNVYKVALPYVAVGWVIVQKHIRLRALLTVGPLSLLLAGNLFALEITGTVRETKGDTATIVTEGDVVPSVGDKVDIFFKLGRAEVSVASGQVADVSASSVEVKIDNATGTVAKGHLARFTSANPQERSAFAAATPVPSPIAAQSDRDPDDVPNTFNEGQSVIEARRPLPLPTAKPRSSPSAPPKAKRFAGRWAVQNENADYVLTLSEDGDRVTGNYTLQGGSLKGVVHGKTLIATWRQPGNRRGGSVRLSLSADGQTLFGPWNYDPATYSSGLNGSGTWTFRRLSGSQ